MILIIVLVLILSSVTGGFVFFLKKDEKNKEIEEIEEVKEIIKMIEIPLLPTDGLIAWYDGKSFDGTIIKDKSGNGNDVTNIEGELVQKDGYLAGGITTKIIFPENVLPPVYTFIHIARYSGLVKGRIFSSIEKNQLSGFWGGLSGVSHFDGWKTEHTKSNTKSNWTLSVDTNKFYRANGTDYTADTPKEHEGVQMTINAGAHKELSEFEFAEIIVYNRELLIEEIEEIEKQLVEKYQIQEIVEEVPEEI